MMMSCSSSKLMNKLEENKAEDKLNAEWIEGFLDKTYFLPCGDHQIRRNEKNRYCINCDESVCQFCVASGGHRHHRSLKMYKHIYKDVVSIGAMEKYMDCSLIQPYKCNKRLAIALNPLPHCGATSTGEASCEICNRRIAEPEVYRYCSIACKVKACKRNPPRPRVSSPPTDPVESTISKEVKEVTPVEKKPRHRRKGIPRRAPLF